MAGLHETTETIDTHTHGELAWFKAELSALAQAASDFPLEYSLGTYELLFESRDDIAVIVANLDESIAGSEEAA
jgi:hypothetical protein